MHGGRVDRRGQHRARGEQNETQQQLAEAMAHRADHKPNFVKHS